ncbi:MAG: GNAT family N-acetyltransferase [Firmicutes bacterium HGW-Firmicutes-10]|nr:MAG: GNAT family N-acetyltransferase [Firmicutes bacterium HGW-Firmicutes-10]
MKLTIKSLWECTAQDFTDYLERLDFGHAPHWAGCYCRFYHNAHNFEEWKNQSASQNKADAIDAINKHEMHGFLAFDEQRCIGWLNANDAQSFMRLKGMLFDPFKDEKTALTICFVIDPQYRNMKVASALLEAAIKHYRQLGYDGMLAVPVDSDGDFALKYRGTAGMFEKAGYVVLEKIDRMSVYWLDLHKID